MPTPVVHGQFMNDDTKLPDWLATPMRPAGGYGATIWAHSVDRGRDDALAVGPDEQDAELVAQGDQLGLGRRPSSPASP